MTAATVTEPAALEALRTIPDPELGRTLGDLKMLGGVKVEGSGGAEVTVVLPTPAYPGRERISEAIAARFAQRFPGAPTPSTRFTHDVKGKNTGGSIGLKVKNVVAVG